MVDADSFDEVENGEEVHVDGPDTPLCLECMKPVDPNSYYCPNCGAATGALTEYLPFVNIQWSVRFYVKMCRQIWSREVSVFGRLVRLLVLVVTWPMLLILLVLLPFMKTDKSDEEVVADDEQDE